MCHHRLLLLRLTISTADAEHCPFIASLFQPIKFLNQDVFYWMFEHFFDGCLTIIGSWLDLSGHSGKKLLNCFNIYATVRVEIIILLWWTVFVVHDFFILFLLSKESYKGAIHRTNPDLLRSCICFWVFQLSFASLICCLLDSIKQE